MYKACSGRSRQIGALAVGEVISVGCMDTYAFRLVNQYIDITGMPDGTYVLTLSADPNHYFTEASTANNTATARLSISGSSMTVLSRSGGVDKSVLPLPKRPQGGRRRRSSARPPANASSTSDAAGSPCGASKQAIKPS